MVDHLEHWWDRVGSHVELMAPLSVIEKILWGSTLSGIIGLMGSFLSRLFR